MSITSSKTEKISKKYRAVLLGDLSVGKSSIIQRYTLNKFDQTANSTVGIDFTLKDIIKKGQTYRLQMWDTAGSQRYRSLIPTYLKNANCVILVFDLTRPQTLDNIKMWHQMFKQNQDAPGIIVGNKNDLTAQRKVKKQQAEQLAIKLNLKYIELSAKTGKKVQEMFMNVLDTIIQKQLQNAVFIEKQQQNQQHSTSMIQKSDDHPSQKIKQQQKVVGPRLKCCY